jgi:hypothetical protein
MSRGHSLPLVGGEVEDEMSDEDGAECPQDVERERYVESVEYPKQDERA